MDERTEVTVELDIFSGRPNPSWTLAPPERDRLLRELRLRTREVAAPRSLPGLGYRGFVLRIAAGGTTEVITVGEGTIERNGALHPDRDRAVERYLLRTMPADLRAQFSAVLPKLAD